MYTVLLWLITLTSLAQTYSYQQPDQLNDGWSTAKLSDVALDTTKLYQLLDHLSGSEHQIHSLLIAKNGKLILEEYYADFSPNKTHDLRSVSKSIRAILMGVAIDKGFIKSVDDLVSKYVKSPLPTKHLDPRKEQITLRHLLTMSSGLECNDWDKKSKGQEDRVAKKKDWMQYTLNLPMVYNPGEVSAYCSMGSILAAEAICQASGMDVDTFAEKYLFEPLGIQNAQWGHTLEKEVRPSGKRLYMTPRDMAKIGQLVLLKGTWNGKQIVPTKWLEEMVAPQTKITGIDYGYFWWTIPFQWKEGAIISRTATGNGGQYIMVIPSLNMVVVFTGGAYNSQEDKFPFAIVRDAILPAFLRE